MMGTKKLIKPLQLQTTTIVRDKSCQITVFRSEKGLWWAIGNCEEHPIKGISAKTYEKAIENWKRGAEYYQIVEYIVN